MDGFGERDAFVLHGKTIEIEKGKRYRISSKDGRVYEGTYLGFLESYPLCRTVTLVEVTQTGGSHDASDAESIFLSFEKRGILHIEEIENDFAALCQVLGTKSPDENYRVELN